MTWNLKLEEKMQEPKPFTEIPGQCTVSPRPAMRGTAASRISLLPGRRHASGIPELTLEEWL